MSHKGSPSFRDNKTREGGLSPGWTVLEQPIPIGGNIIPAQNVATEPIKEDEEDNATAGPSATYVTSQSDYNHDVMDQIANEFQRAAKSRRSHNNQDESSTGEKGSEARSNGQILENDEPEKPLIAEETEVWTGGEGELSDLTDNCTDGGNNPTLHNIAENTETTVREDTDTTNTISLSSEGGSNSDIPATELEVRPVNNAEEHACGGSDTAQRPQAVTLKCTKQVIESTSNETSSNATSNVQYHAGTSSITTAPSTSTRAINQPSVVGQSMTKPRIQDGRPPDGRPSNSRRWNFSVNGNPTVRVDHPAGSVPETNGNTCLTLYQTKFFQTGPNSKHLQTRKINVPRNFRLVLGREGNFVTCIFSFSHNVFKMLLFQGR